MLRFSLKVIISILFLITVFFPKEYSSILQSAHVNKKMSHYNGNPRTIAHDFLEMEKPFGADHGSFSYLNSLLDKAVKRIKVKKKYSSRDAFNILSNIHALLKEEGFIFKNNYLLSRGLKNRVIDCDNYTTIYTAIAEVTGLPILPVYAPNHSFIRFNFYDGSYINWEVTTGRYRTNAYYKKKLLISNSSIKKGVYLKSLSRKEFLGVQLNTLGNFLFSKKKYRSSIIYYDRSSNYYPNYSASFYNKGLSLYTLKIYGDALKNFQKSLSLDPSRASTHNNIAGIFFIRKNYKVSIGHYLKSIKLNPRNSAPYYNIALIMELTGKKRESKKWKNRAKKIEGLFKNR